MPFRGALPKSQNRKGNELTVEEILRLQNGGTQPPRQNGLGTDGKEKRKSRSSDKLPGRDAHKHERAASTHKKKSFPVIVRAEPESNIAHDNVVQVDRIEAQHSNKTKQISVTVLDTNQRKVSSNPHFKVSKPPSHTEVQEPKQPKQHNIANEAVGNHKTASLKPKNLESTRPTPTNPEAPTPNYSHTKMSKPGQQQHETIGLPQKRKSKSNVGPGVVENVHNNDKPAKRKSKSDVAQATGTSPVKRKSKPNIADPLGAGTAPVKRKSKSDVQEPILAKRKSKSNVQEPILAKRKSKSNVADAEGAGVTPAKRKSKSNVADAIGVSPAKRISKSNVADARGVPPAKRKSKSNVQDVVPAPAKRKSKSNVAETAEAAQVKRKSKTNVPEGARTTLTKRKSQTNVVATGVIAPAKRKSKADLASPKNKIGISGENVPTRHMKSTDVGMAGTVAAQRRSRTKMLPHPPKKNSKINIVGTTTKAKPNAGAGAAGAIPGKKVSKADIRGKPAVANAFAPAVTGSAAQNKRDSNKSNASGKLSNDFPKRKSKSDVTNQAPAKRKSNSHVTAGDGGNRLSLQKGNPERKRSSVIKKKGSQGSLRKTSRPGPNAPKKGSKGNIAAPPAPQRKSTSFSDLKKRGGSNNMQGGNKIVPKKPTNQGKPAPPVQRQVSFSRKISVTKFHK